MRVVASVSIWLALCVGAFAQSRTVWLEDYSGEELIKEIAAGKTTLIYFAGSVHADGPVTAVGKHLRVAAQVAQRVAGELGNALVLPVNPYSEAQIGPWFYREAGASAATAGTISLTPETYALVTTDVVNSTLTDVRDSKGLVGTGFKNVVIMGDHTQGQNTLERAAKDLDADWKPKGVRVYYINLATSGKTAVSNYLKKLDQNIPDSRITPIEDAAELLSVDRDHTLVHEENMPAAERKLVTVAMGKTFIGLKVATAVEQIRKLTVAEQ